MLQHSFAPCSSSRLRAGGVRMLPYLNAMVLKCGETLQAAPRRRPLAIAHLFFLPPRVTFQINEIVCVVASTGLVRAAHACLCTSHERPSSTAALLLPLFFPPLVMVLPSGARTSVLAFRSAPWATRNSIAATWPFAAALWKAELHFYEGARTQHGRCSKHETSAA